MLLDLFLIKNHIFIYVGFIDIYSNPHNEQLLTPKCPWPGRTLAGHDVVWSCLDHFKTLYCIFLACTRAATWPSGYLAVKS